MSWLKSAVSKAREVGNKNNLTRAVKSYADTVVQQAGQAVAEGAKILQDRIGNRSFRSVKQTVKRLEAAAISCRGSERVLLLKRWLLVLKEVDTLTRVSSEEKQKPGEQPDSMDEATDNIKKLSTVLYYDSDIGDEPMTFRDVFLKSQALEGITLSAILQAPSEEEVSLLMELYGLCLTGAKEVHIAILSSIQDLAAALASYHDEVLVKQEELLQFAQAAITGLKISADLGRLDLEAKVLKKQLEEITSSEKQPSKDHEKESSETNKLTVEVLKEALVQIRICSRLEEILIRKKNLSLGDSPEIHAQKIDKLKVLSESLANSTAKSEKRIVEQRSQKEEALKVRVSKADEANEKEKEIAAEISVLEQQRDKLEAELKKVNISLAAANARLCNAREERDQFDVANNQIIEHWATKEVELSKSIVSCKVEKDVISTWINFMEDTWVLQRTYAEIKEKETDDELKDHEHHFLNLAIHLLSDYKKELGPWINQIEKFVVNLRKLSEGSEISSADDENSTASHPRKNLEEQYLECETKIISTFSVVDAMREQFHSPHGANSRKDDTRVKEIFEDIEKLRARFESIERPTLELENPTLPPKAEETAAHKTPETSTEQSSPDTTSSPKHQSEHPQLPTVEAQQVLDHAAELAKLESEFGQHGGDYSTEEIGDWEFDELERELRGDETATNK